MDSSSSDPSSSSFEETGSVNRRRFVHQKASDFGLENSNPSSSTLVQMDGVGADDDDDESRNNKNNKYKRGGSGDGDLSPVWQDRIAVPLLLVLYFIQGIPQGLIFGTIPFFLQSRITYTAAGAFSLAAYPYSLKFLWAPLVDAFYSSKIGRRRTWIIPSQILAGLLFFYLSGALEDMLSIGEVDVTRLTLIFFVLIFLAATQDIAVDGWALTLLTEDNASLQPMCQSIGLNFGFMASFTGFLGLSSAEVCNTYFRSTPLPDGIISLSGFLQFSGALFLAVTFILIFLNEYPGRSATQRARCKQRLAEEGVDGIQSTYRLLWILIKKRPIWYFTAFLVVTKMAFGYHDAISGLKIVAKGFPKETIAGFATIDGILSIPASIYISSWCKRYTPLRVYTIGVVGRTVFGLVTLWLFSGYEQLTENQVYYSVLVIFITYSLFTNITFSAQCAFIANVSDERFGGTYMTLLNTVANLSGSWSRAFLLAGVDYFTMSFCTTIDENTESCWELDGYYVVAGISLFITLALIPLLVSLTRKLRVLRKQDWELKLGAD